MTEELCMQLQCTRNSPLYLLKSVSPHDYGYLAKINVLVQDLSIHFQIAKSVADNAPILISFYSLHNANGSVTSQCHDVNMICPEAIVNLLHF